jgi:hypothetical protein
MNTTITKSSARREAAFYEAGRAVAACCMGIRFQRATISPGPRAIGTVENANLVVSEALSESALGRQQIIDRHIRSLLVGAIMAKRVAGRSKNPEAFLSVIDRECIDNHLRHRGGIAGEAARQQHLARLMREARSLAGRKDFQVVVEQVADELLTHDEYAYFDIMQVLIRHAVRSSRQSGFAARIREGAGIRD